MSNDSLIPTSCMMFRKEQRVFMKRYTIIFSIIVALLVYINSLFFQERGAEENGIQQNILQQNEHIIQWARTHLPQTGVLTEAEDGFVYLKVDDDYIKQLFFMIPHLHYEMPPYFRRSDSPGAHITVFYVDERKRKGKIHEIGQTYSFTIKGLMIVPPKTQEYVILEVKSLDLEHLREKYGFPPLIKNHEFHITIAKKTSNMHEVFTN